MIQKTVIAGLLTPLLLQMVPAASHAATIKVPLQKATIQAAIDSASTGDVIVVSPGTYFENIDFKGKAISVTAQRGARPVIIDGNNAGPVVTFHTSEGAGSVLSGFTLQNGMSGFSAPCYGDGGGVCISNASPTIEYNTITNNGACEGNGIAINFGSPLVTNNLISNNIQAGCSGGTGGGGIEIGGAASARIIDNVIENNSTGSDGGGISLFASGTPTISGNIIRGNSASHGGAMSMYNQSDVNVVQNLIIGNSAQQGGGGIYWLLPSGRSPFVINNTIADNVGEGIYADGFDGTSRIINNVIVGASGSNALYCGNSNDTNNPIIHYNDVYAASGSAYGGLCTDQSGKQGNIGADPLFVSATTGDYHLQIGSPAIDKGTNAAPRLPSTDFDGTARIQDGNLDTIATVDMGVDEFTPGGTTAPFAATNPHARTPVHDASRNRTANRSGSTDSNYRHSAQIFDRAGHLVAEVDAKGVTHRVR